MTTPLQEMQQRLKKDLGIEDWFEEASNHEHGCKCDYCRAWWKAMGADPDTNMYGPFTKEEIE